MSNLMTTVLLGIKGKAMTFFKGERGEVNIVTTIVLMGVAIALAVVFKDNMKNIINALLGSVNTKADTVIQAD